jgi:hypothetical protein
MISARMHVRHSGYPDDLPSVFGLSNDRSIPHPIARSTVIGAQICDACDACDGLCHGKNEQYQRCDDVTLVTIKTTRMCARARMHTHARHEGRSVTSVTASQTSISDQKDRSYQRVAEAARCDARCDARLATVTTLKNNKQLAFGEIHAGRASRTEDPDEGQRLHPGTCGSDRGPGGAQRRDRAGRRPARPVRARPQDRATARKSPRSRTAEIAPAAASILPEALASGRVRRDAAAAWRRGTPPQLAQYQLVAADMPSHPQTLPHSARPIAAVPGQRRRARS